MPSPTQIIVSESTAAISATDADGRVLQLRRLTALDRLRLFKAVGPALAQNEPYLGMAILACSVTAIDGVPIPPAINEAQIEGVISRLGDVGLAAAVAALEQDGEPDAAERRVAAGN